MDSEIDNGMPTDKRVAEENVPLSKAANVNMKLKLVANCIIDGLAPVVAVITMIVAVMALNGNKSLQVML